MWPNQNAKPQEHEVYLKYVLEPKELDNLLNAATLGDLAARKEVEFVYKVFSAHLPTINSAVHVNDSWMFLSSQKHEYAMNVSLKIIRAMTWRLDHWMKFTPLESQKLLLLAMWLKKHDTHWWRSCPTLYHRWIIRSRPSNEEEIAFSLNWLHQAAEYALVNGKDAAVIFMDLSWFYYSTMDETRVDFVLRALDIYKSSKLSFGAKIELDEKWFPISDIEKWARSVANAPELEDGESFEFSVAMKSWRNGSACVVKDIGVRFLDKETLLKELDDFVKRNDVRWMSPKKRMVVRNVVVATLFMLQAEKQLPDVWNNVLNEALDEEAVEDIQWINGAVRTRVGQFPILIDAKDSGSWLFHLVTARARMELGHFALASKHYDLASSALNAQNNVLYGTCVEEGTLATILANDGPMTAPLVQVAVKPFAGKNLVDYSDGHILRTIHIFWNWSMRNPEDPARIFKTLLTMAMKKPDGEVDAAVDDRHYKEMITCLIDLLKLKFVTLKDGFVTLPLESEAFNSWLFSSLSFSKKIFTFLTQDTDLLVLLCQVAVSLVHPPLPDVLLGNMAIDIKATRAKMIRSKDAVSIAIYALDLLLTCDNNCGVEYYGCLAYLLISNGNTRDALALMLSCLKHALSNEAQGYPSDARVLSFVYAQCVQMCINLKLFHLAVMFADLSESLELMKNATTILLSQPEGFQYVPEIVYWKNEISFSYFVEELNKAGKLNGLPDKYQRLTSLESIIQRLDHVAKDLYKQVNIL